MYVSSKMKAGSLHAVVTPAKRSRTHPLSCILTALLAAIAAFMVGGGQPGQTILAAGFIGWPASIGFMWAISRDRADAAQARIVATEQRALRAEGKLVTATAEAAGLQQTRDQLAGQLAEAQARIKQLEGIVHNQAFKVHEAEKRAKLTIPLEAELSHLRSEHARLVRETSERRAWRTLPQGHDTESEQFAAAVASALK